MAKIHFGCFKERKNLWKDRLWRAGEAAWLLGCAGRTTVKIVLQHRFCDNSKVAANADGTPKLSPWHSAAGIHAPEEGSLLTIPRDIRFSALPDPLHLRDILQVQGR